MTPTLHIALLGDFRLDYDDGPVTTVNTPRLQSLLAYLALRHDAPQSRQHLAYLLWPDSTEAQARTNLRKHIHLLRRALPEPDCFLHADMKTLGWQPEAPFTLDATEFEHALAQLVDLLTQSQLRRQLGALPVLYALLETLQVRKIINRHCPTKAEVDYGTVAIVLVLNRLLAPRPLYQVANWLARTVLVYALGVPAAKFNDDRLGRVLDAISQHARDIWQDIVHRDLVQADIDLSLIFYDLTAFVVHGAYSDSQHVDLALLTTRR